MAPAAAPTSVAVAQRESDPAEGYTIVEPTPRVANANGTGPRTEPALHHRSSSNGGNETPTPKHGALKPVRPARPTMTRSRSDFISNRFNDQDEMRMASGNHLVDSSDFHIRHGFENQLLSEEYNDILNSNFLMYFTAPLHEAGGNPKDKKDRYAVTEWRMKDRLKTMSAALLMCLNIGVDPPDVIKTSPFAKLECWIDPTGPMGQPGHQPLDKIGKTLQTQYETLSIRTRYRMLLDPTVEETKKYCTNMRRTARSERVLIHYNGHGVPRPTPSGEIWVFNKGYTQYIPVSLFDFQLWTGSPSINVWDCSHAGSIISNWNKLAEKHQTEGTDPRRGDDPDGERVDFSDCIHLAATGEKELLPTNPNLPADLFTSCLTTPIEMAVRFFILQNPLKHYAMSPSDANIIPGRISERRTPLGELNWIFTAITDTIAWNSLPKPLFKKLFRQDLMVAALFRNFLLAQRVMRVYQCHPQSHPKIPPTHDHPLWESWDMAVDLILNQLPDLLAAERGEKAFEYKHSSFFQDQLTAFDVYLNTDAMNQKPPEQLPIVLQVLLSQVHRLRALVLLSKFLDLGPWAVNLALSIGIFPYVLKLLQSQAVELKPVMVFIWARILAVDQTCQNDLLKDNGYQYFISLLNPQVNIPVHNVSEHRAMCAFIIAMFCKDFSQGQHVCCTPELMETLLRHLNQDDPVPGLRQYSLLCISNLWVDHPDAKWLGIRKNAVESICALKNDAAQEVRAAMLYALTTFLGIPGVEPEVAWVEECTAATVLHMANDGNVMVRKELTVFFSTLVARYSDRFCVTAFEHLLEEKKKLTRTMSDDHQSISEGTTFDAVWKQVMVMSVDPYPEVADNACTIIDAVYHALLDGPLREATEELMEHLSRHRKDGLNQKQVRLDVPSTPPAPSTPTTPTKNEGYFSFSMKRTASVAASLRNLAFGGSNESTPQNARNSHENAASKIPSYNGPPTVPYPRGYVPKQSSARPSIPLKSTYFEWALQYFLEPQMKAPEADEPGSREYNKRLWRRNRNDRIMAETQPQKEMASSNQWDKVVGSFDNTSQPGKMLFHQFEDQLIVADDKDVINVWNWKHQARLSRFSNQNPAGSKITEIRLINEDDQALLMTGSSDGVIKIFRNFEEPENVQIVSAFRALTDLVPSNKNAGLVFDWQQGRGDILVAGDVRVIKVWRAGPEKVDQSIPARSGSCVTSLTSDQVEGNIVIGGFGDGKVRVYDRRVHPANSMVKVWKEHSQWITNVHLQRGGQRELVSACRGGTVKLWDVRMDRSVRTIQATKDGTRTLSVHEHAPVFAVGTNRHRVKLFNVDGMKLSSFEPYSGFLHANRGAPIVATAFHPHHMMVAGAAQADTHIHLYAVGTHPARQDGKDADGES